MKRTWLALSSLALAPLAAAPQEPPKPPAPPAAPAGPESPFKTPKEKLSYGIGVQIGMSLKAQGLDIDPDLLMQGLKGSLAGAPLQMTEAEIRQIMRETQQKVAAQQAERNRVVGDKNKKEGEAFLVANKAKEGVTVLPSGLQYKILKAGDGKKPGPNDMVTVHYRGTLIDGTEFDSSARHGQPAKFKVNGVIPGWTEALQLMPAGSKWQLVIPSALAYGERGTGPIIGPSAVLLFEVELISVP